MGVAMFSLFNKAGAVLLVLVATGLVEPGPPAPVQVGPCNPEVQTCL